MKPTCFLLFVFLGFTRLSLTVSSIDESTVKSYSILRRTTSGNIPDYDVFTVNMKDGRQCAKDGQVYLWCNTLSADEQLLLTWSNRSSCSCTCKRGSQCFLPSLQTCINASVAKSFGGCQEYFHDELLQVPVNLQSGGNEKTSVSVDNYTCNLQGHYFDYNGFKGRWENTPDGIFKLKEQGSQGGHKQFSIMWDVGTDGNLSGRIIRLNFTCKSLQQPSTICNRCMLFKALGKVTYYSPPLPTLPSVQPSVQSSLKTSVQPSVQSSVKTSVQPSVQSSVKTSVQPSVQSSVKTSVQPSVQSSVKTSVQPSVQSSVKTSVQPSVQSSVKTSVQPSVQSSKKTSVQPSPSQPPPPQPSVSSPPSSSSPSLGSASTGILTPSPSTRSQTRSLHTRPASPTSGPIVQTSKTELQSSLPFHSEEASNVVVSTGIPKHTISTVGPYPIKPSKSSLATKAASSSATIDGPGNKEARANGNNNGVVIGAAVGGAVVLVIFAIVIIVLCKRRKLWKNKEKATKLQVKNPVYGSSDIPLSTPTENQVIAPSEQDSQPAYQGLIINNRQVNGSALYSSPEDDYDNYTVYQSLDKKIPGTPVYQSLKKGQAVTGQPNPKPKPKPSVIGQPSERPKLLAEPVYNVLEQPGAEQGTMPEEVYEDPERENRGDTQDPLYNVLEGPDAEQNYEAPDVGDPLYNVLEGPESKQGPQEPLYNVLERPESKQGPREPLYNVLERPESKQGPQEPLYNVLERPESKQGPREPLYNVLEGPESKQGPQEPLYNVLESSDAENNPPGTQGLYDGSNSEPLYNILEGPDSGGPNKGGVGYAAPNGSTSPDAHDNPAYEQSLELDAPYASVHRPGSQRESVYEPLQGPDKQELYEPLSKRGT